MKPTFDVIVSDLFDLSILHLLFLGPETEIIPHLRKCQFLPSNPKQKLMTISKIMGVTTTTTTK